jgi:hypothetical protein
MLLIRLIPNILYYIKSFNIVHLNDIHDYINAFNYIYRLLDFNCFFKRAFI